MPKFKLLVDVDSVVDEAEHLEEIFKDGFDCSEEEAERIVSAKVKVLMIGGPYYSIVEADDDEDDAPVFVARDHHLIKPTVNKMTGGK